MTADRAVDRALERIAVDCRLVVEDLDRLAGLLAGGQGDPEPYEMTPDQYERLVDTLGEVGIRGGMLLVADVATTNQRESEADWPGLDEHLDPHRPTH